MSRSVDDLSAEVWNDPMYRGGQRVSWTAPLCEDCWWFRERESGRSPVRVRPSDAKVCAICGIATRSGIFLRIPPDEQMFKAWEWLEQ